MLTYLFSTRIIMTKLSKQKAQCIRHITNNVASIFLVTWSRGMLQRRNE